MTRRDVIHNRRELCDLLHEPHDATDNTLSEKLNIPCGARIRTESYGVYLSTSEVLGDILLFPFSTKTWRRAIALLAINFEAAMFENGL